MKSPDNLAELPLYKHHYGSADEYAEIGLRPLDREGDRDE